MGKGVVLDDGQPLADFNHDDKGFYYHEGEITDWEDEYQLIHLEMMGLATFNEKILLTVVTSSLRFKCGLIPEWMRYGWTP